ncbi:MAG: nitrate reductase associated protein [Cyanobacteriota bacterium]|nr:nitrate reductase associated protein [Cyanobacteriota bacterium]
MTNPIPGQFPWQPFDFEADFVNDLRCIPLGVRYKLDSCGVKLKLPHWHRFTLAQRQTLITLPCQTPAEVQAYRQRLRQWVYDQTGEWPTDLAIDPEPAWGRLDHIPPSVTAQASRLGTPLSLDQWQALSPLQRFALIKLSQAGHEHRNFALALMEFNLSPVQPTGAPPRAPYGEICHLEQR